MFIEVTKFDVEIRLVLSTRIILVVKKYISLVLISKTSFHNHLLSLIAELMTYSPLLGRFVMHIFLDHTFPEHIRVLEVLESMPQTKGKVVDVVLQKCLVWILVFSKGRGEVRGVVQV